jgi:hypothetical protein
MRTMIRVSFLLVLVSLLAGCGGGEDDERIAGWLGPPKATRSGEVEVDSFNRYADDAAEPSFEISPLRTALEFLGLDNRRVRMTSVVLTQPAEGGDEAEVTATLDGLLDDSIRAERYVLVLERRDDVWRLRSARWAQQCQANRGHQNFSTELCV